MKNLSAFRLTERQGRTLGANLAFKSAELTLRALRDYHRHEVVGLANIPKSGGALLVCSHSFATYDGWFFGVVIRDELQREPLAILDRNLMRPPFGAFFRQLGFIESSREGVVDLLRKGELLGLVPGGMREALRSSHDKYRVSWEGRLGFVWTSLLSGAPIVLAACPRADDIYDVADLTVTRRIYERFRLPLPLFRGLGPTVVPRPVKLTHLVSEPIVATVPPDRVTEADVVAHHGRVVERMNRLMRDALELSP